MASERRQAAAEAAGGERAACLGSYYTGVPKKEPNFWANVSADAGGMSAEHVAVIRHESGAARGGSPWAACRRAHHTSWRRREGNTIFRRAGGW